jgi:adenylate cyclase
MMRRFRGAYLERDDWVQGSGHGSLVGALEGLYGGAEHRYLNFYGPPGTIRNIPFQDVVTGRGITTPDLSDTVVFVGYSDLYDPGQLDRFYTVYTREDGVDLAGVEIAATAFANLLQDSALKPLGIEQLLALLGLFGLVFSLIAFLLPAAWGVSLCLAIWIGYGVLAQWLFSHAIWLPLTVPLLVQAPLAIFVGVFGQYRFERQRGARISAAINYYLPETIAREFAAGRIDPDSANNVSYGTCFATDMAGFSSIAQNMNPRDLAVFLNQYFEELARALNAHKVDVTEFRADAIMCAWMGAENDVMPRRRAIQAALQAQDVMEGFGADQDINMGGLRVGLESGWFYVGHAGGGGHFVYSIVGDCANTASRLEGLNKYLGTRIIASAAVIADIEDFAVRPLGLFQLKGKDEATAVFEILGERSENVSADPRLEPFAEALRAFQSHDLVLARKGFQELLAQWPEDGPSGFFLNECDLNVVHGPEEDGQPRVIHMEMK